MRSTSAAIRRSCSSAAPTGYGRGGKTIAVYRDFGLERRALASTVSHDSHNFTVSYHDPKDAFRAAEILRACGGGACVIDGAEETHIALPAAGLMSQKPCAEVADEIAAVQAALDAISGGRLTLLATAVMALPGAAERGHYGYGPRQRHEPDVRTRVCGCGSINESANEKG